MAKSDTIHCGVITPERVYLDCDARFVAFPIHDGELGALRNRAPLVCKLGIGPVRVDAEGETHHLFIDGGFAQIVENRLTILTEQARAVKDIDASACRQKLVEARAMPTTSDAEFTARQKAVRRAQVQIHLAESHRSS